LGQRQRLWSKVCQSTNDTYGYTGNGNIDSVKSKIDENTKCIYVETIGNPSFYIPDFAALKTLADQYEIPIVVDNTFGMAGYTCRPLQLGAHIIVASATKWIGGHGTTIGGVIVDSSSFAWDKPVRSVLGDPSSPPVTQDGKPKAKFPLINGPCEAYHDMNLWDVFGPRFYYISFVIHMKIYIYIDTDVYVWVHSSRSRCLRTYIL
jgi:O-acetylhomoserine/O-acetylserine sulfhydrylase